MFFLSQFYFEAILDGFIPRFYFPYLRRNVILVVLHSCDIVILIYPSAEIVGLPMITTTENIIGQKVSSDHT